MNRKKPSRTDLKKAKKLHKMRSKKAREVDESILSKTTPYYDVYETDPSRWDMFGVDTPKRRRR